MVEVRLRDGRSMEQRIHDRLRSSSPADGKRPQDRLASDHSAETHPTRTKTTIYHAGGASLHGPAKRSGD